MPLPTSKQVGSSCVLLSSCIILSELTKRTIADVAHEFIDYANNFLDNNNLDRDIVNHSDPFDAYNSFCKETMAISPFNNGTAKIVFDDLCKEYNIVSKLVYFNVDSQEIEAALKTGNSFVSLSFEHKFTGQPNSGWHITAVGFENGKFYTSDTNEERILEIGDSISDLYQTLIITYGIITDIGDGVLYTKT